jgi:hypothetical protein
LRRRDRKSSTSTSSEVMRYMIVLGVDAHATGVYELRVI